MSGTRKGSVPFDVVKRTVPLTALLERFGVLSQLKRTGRQLVGCCPIHKGTNKKQFVVNPDRNLWTCFGDCRSGGSTLEFVAAMENVGIKEAAERIVEWFALATPRRQSQPANKRRRTHVSGKPSHKVFVVEDRGEGEDNDAFWTRVGSAWPHKDGKGLNVQLASGVAVSGRVVLREYTDQDAAEDDKKAATKKRK